MNKKCFKNGDTVLFRNKEVGYFCGDRILCDPMSDEEFAPPHCRFLDDYDDELYVKDRSQSEWDILSLHRTVFIEKTVSTKLKKVPPLFFENNLINKFKRMGVVFHTLSDEDGNIHLYYENNKKVRRLISNELKTR